MQTVHVRIAGRVQGVGYRAWTAEHAALANLNGWVRNCSDGTVEAMLQGSPQTIETFLKKCNAGPRFAKVFSINVENVESPEIFPNFIHKKTI